MIDELLRALALDKDSYIICGSYPLLIRGLRNCHDLDVIVPWSTYSRLREYADRINKYGSICVGTTEFIYLGDDEFNRRIVDAEIYDGLTVASLRTTLRWKTKLGRDKDVEDIRVIHATCVNLQ